MKYSSLFTVLCFTSNMAQSISHFQKHQVFLSLPFSYFSDSHPQPLWKILTCLALAKLSLERLEMNTSPATDYTLKIPDHVLELLFENLGAPDCFGAPKRVSRRWNNIIRSTSTRMWKHFCVKRSVYALKGYPLLQRDSVASKTLESLAVEPEAGDCWYLFKWLQESGCRKIKHLGKQ